MGSAERTEGLTDIAFPSSAWVGFLEKYRTHVAALSEVPDAFHWASIVTAVGLLLGHRVCIRYPLRIFLNFYALLLAPTGTKKSSAINLAMRLLAHTTAGRSILQLHGLSTAEGLVAILAKEPGTRVLVVEEEFRALLRKAQANGNGQLMPYLQRLFDAPDRVDLPTRGNPLTAESPLVALLTASAPEALEDVLGDVEVYGGLVNRFLPISGESKPPEPWPVEPDTATWAALAADVEAIVDAYGTATTLDIVAPDARTLWEVFYRDFRTQQAKWPSPLPTLTQRLDLHARKIACFYAAIRSARTIGADDLARAIELADYFRRVTERVVSPIAQNPTARLERRIAAILSEKPCTRRELHQRIGGRVKTVELSRVLGSLIDMERIVEFDGGLLAWADAPYMNRFSGDEAGREAGTC